jgi:hypothetical protein
MAAAQAPPAVALVADERSIRIITFDGSHEEWMPFKARFLAKQRFLRRGAWLKTCQAPAQGAGPTAPPAAENAAYATYTAAMDAVYYELIQGCRGEAFDVVCLVADGLLAWNALVDHYEAQTEATITHYYTIVREAWKSPAETVTIFIGRMDRMFSSLTGLGEAVSDNYKRSALISALLTTEGPDTAYMYTHSHSCMTPTLPHATGPFRHNTTLP